MRHQSRQGDDAMNKTEMLNEFTYRLSVLRLLYSEPLKRIHADPRMSRSTREMIDEVLLWRKDVFPFVLDSQPENICRLRQVSEGFARVLGHIADDPETPHSIKTVITHTFVRFGHHARHRRAWEPLPPATDEVCAAAKKIPPPRRPALRVYEPGDDRPREVLVFRRRGRSARLI
jgi:hypothetical protein